MTRCIITIKMPYGYHSVFINSDGYPRGIGFSLVTQSSSRELAEDLVCRPCGYGAGTVISKSIPDFLNVDYHYIWGDKQEKWLYRECGKGRFKSLCNDTYFKKLYKEWKRQQDKPSPKTNHFVEDSEDDITLENIPL